MKWLSNFYEDKVNSVVTSSFAVGVWLMSIPYDLSRGSYWWAAVDVVVVLAGCYFTKIEAGELRKGLK